MIDIDEIMEFPYDPWLLLGVPRDTGDKTVRSAWKKAGSPESGPVAQAYEMLKDEDSRIQTRLLCPRPFSKPSDAVNSMRKHPVFLGPGIWYREIMRRSRS